MLRSRTRWKVRELDAAKAEQLARELQLDALLAKLLVVRGISDKRQAERFLSGGPEQFHDPFLLDGMKTAVDAIRQAIRSQQKIRIYGDYDADGVSSTSLMILLMKQLGAHFDYYIPHRIAEGYGLNANALDHAKKNGVSLIVTVDTGISARDEIAYANELGLEVIVTDHHEPPQLLPEALAVINPKKPGCPYPFKQLAGVGVALKLAHALLGRLPEEFLEIAAIGTVADLMPLVDENRAIVKWGLQRMRQTSLLGVKALLGVAGIKQKELTASHVAFALAPRINASGRLDNADDAVKLLTTSSEQEAEHLAHDLDQLNKERQRIVEETTGQALQQLERAGATDNVIVLGQENWNVGVIGIVASKLLEKYYRPIVILSIDPQTGICKGSARSVPGFDIYRALTECGDLLDHYGGHQAAAGMTMRVEHISELRNRLNRLADEWLTEEDYIPISSADLVCRLDEVPIECIERIDSLAPFGMGNPSPRCIFTGLQIQEMRAIGKDRQHLKMIVSQAEGDENGTMDAVAFGQADLAENISSTARLDVLGELSINEWNGTRKPQLLIHDMRVPHSQVFDWRGVDDPGAKLLDWACNRHQTGTIALLLSSPDEADTLPEPLKRPPFSIWAASPQGEVERCGGDESVRFADLKHIVLYSMPRMLQPLQSALRQAAGAERIYAVFYDRRKAEMPLPSRDMFKHVYKAMMSDKGENRSGHRLASLSKRTGLSAAMIQFILSVFEELSLVEQAEGYYRCMPDPAKKDLASSSLYRQKMHRAEAERVLVYSTAEQLTEWILSHIRPVHVHPSSHNHILEGIV